MANLKPRKLRKAGLIRQNESLLRRQNAILKRQLAILNDDLRALEYGSYKKSWDTIAQMAEGSAKMWVHGERAVKELARVIAEDNLKKVFREVLVELMPRST